MKWLVGVVVVLAGLYVAYTLKYPTYSYRYRITVEVETADGVKRGSSVLQTKLVQFPYWFTLGNNTYLVQVKGEAVFVDLGNGRNLVALLALGPGAEDGRASLFAPRSFFQIKNDVYPELTWTRELSTMTGRREYAGDKRPTLVTFGDLNDPATVREVPFNTPASVLGDDVRSVQAWIELTKDPVTSGLEKKLPWIGDFDSARTVRLILNNDRAGTATPLDLFRRDRWP